MPRPATFPFDPAKEAALNVALAQIERAFPKRPPVTEAERVTSYFRAAKVSVEMARKAKDRCTKFRHLNAAASTRGYGLWMQRNPVVAQMKEAA